MEVAGAGGKSCTEKAVGATQTRSGADISQPANFSRFCFLASETSWFLPVHPFPSLHCAAGELGEVAGGGESKGSASQETPGFL